MAGPQDHGRTRQVGRGLTSPKAGQPPTPRPTRLPSAGESEVCSRCWWGGCGHGQRAGPGVCWGPTHRSCALGVEPSRPLPAVPLLEHAASCEELLVVGGHSTQTQARRTPRAGQGGRDPPPDTSGGAGQRGAGARTRDPSPGSESSSRAPPAPWLPALGIPSR